MKHTEMKYMKANYAEHRINITSDAEDLEATDWVQFIYTFDPGVSISCNLEPAFIILYSVISKKSHC